MLFACRKDASERVLRCVRRGAAVGLQHSRDRNSAWWVQHTIVIDRFVEQNTHTPPHLLSKHPCKKTQAHARLLMHESGNVHRE